MVKMYVGGINKKVLYTVYTTCPGKGVYWDQLVYTENSKQKCTL